MSPNDKAEYILLAFVLIGVGTLIAIFFFARGAYRRFRNSPNPWKHQEATLAGGIISVLAIVLLCLWVWLMP